MLRDDLYGEVVFEHLNLRIVAYGVHQAALYLKTGVVLMVEDAELGVAALAVQVEGTVGLFVEVDAPLHEVVDGCGSVLYHMLHRLRVGEPVAGHHGVVDVLCKVVDLEVGHRGYAALGFGRIGLVEGRLADDGDGAFARVGDFQCETHTGYAAADDEKVIMVNHRLNKCVIYLLTLQS